MGSVGARVPIVLTSELGTCVAGRVSEEADEMISVHKSLSERSLGLTLEEGKRMKQELGRSWAAKSSQ